MKRYILGLMMLVATQGWCAEAQRSPAAPSLLGRIKAAITGNRNQGPQAAAPQATTLRPAQPAQAQGGGWFIIQLRKFMEGNDEMYQAAVTNLNKSLPKPLVSPEVVSRMRRVALEQVDNPRNWPFFIEHQKQGIEHRAFHILSQIQLAEIFNQDAKKQCSVCLQSFIIGEDQVPVAEESNQHIFYVGCSTGQVANSPHLRVFANPVCKDCLCKTAACPFCRFEGTKQDNVTGRALHENATVQITIKPGFLGGQ